MYTDRKQFGHYLIQRTLGKGATGKVKLAIKEESGELVALKIFARTLVERFHIEANALETVSPHRNIVRISCSVPKATYNPRHKSPREVAYVEMEYCSRGELISFIFSRGAFPEPIAKRCALELLHGLTHIHSRSLAHRDLKPDNILVTEEFEIKIADFGYAIEVGDDGARACRTYRGTPGYMAPEVLNRQSYNGQKADIFALGIIIYTLYVNRPPFVQALPHDRYYQFIEANNWREFWVHTQRAKSTPVFSPDFRSMIEGLLCRDPSARLTCEGLLAHPWISSGACGTEEMVAWLRGAQAPRLQLVQPGDDSDSPFRTLQMSRDSSFGSNNSDELSLFRHSSRAPVPVTHTQTAFYTNLHPDLVFEAVSNYCAKREAGVKKDSQMYYLKARMPGSEDCLEVGVSICEENLTAKAEFRKISGSFFEFSEFIREFMRQLAED